MYVCVCYFTQNIICHSSHSRDVFYTIQVQRLYMCPRKLRFNQDEKGTPVLLSNFQQYLSEDSAIAKYVYVFYISTRHIKRNGNTCLRF